MLRQVVASIEGEFRRYKALGEAAMAQLSDDELCAAGPAGGNSIAVLVWHVAGNFQSRFTDFLTTDGEKPWRQREEEFAARQVSRAELLEKWMKGWTTLLTTLSALNDGHLAGTVTIRRQPLRVDQALHRSLAHAAYHVGQIVYLARALRGANWNYLSIPPGQSEAYNRAPTNESAAGHAAALDKQSRGS